MENTYLKVYLLYSRGILIDVMESMEAIAMLVAVMGLNVNEWVAIEVPVTLLSDITPSKSIY
jgi:hypothetical protein